MTVGLTQFRIPSVETVLFGLMVLTVAGLGANTLVKAYAVLAKGASVEPLNNALAVFIAGICIMMITHVLKRQREILQK